MRPKDLYELSDTQLLESAGGAQSGSQVDRAVQMEFQRRASVAQIEAGIAAKETAKWTKYSSIAIAVSVVVMAFGTVIN